MQKHLGILATVAVVATLALPALAQDPSADADTVVATVNGTEITLGHMIIARATLPQQYQELPDAVLFSGILDQLIQQTAMSQSFEGDLPKRVQLSLDNEQRSLLAGEIVERALQGAVTEEALQAAYDARFAEVPQEEEYNASHILVETEEAAKAIKEELDNGADFAATAREKSTGPSGPNGGSLGWFGPGMMVPSFEAATVALKPGEVSDPVQTQFGWHVILLNEVRMAEIPDLEAVRDDLSSTILQETAQNVIDDLTSSATVERIDSGTIDPSILKQLDLVN
jgi:peptidyl-prolyl cis-trans isomerase C